IPIPVFRRPFAINYLIQPTSHKNYYYNLFQIKIII
ncbi:hypothetical protein HMPREF1051_2680, partial [Neisseria sicca VK64]